MSVALAAHEVRLGLRRGEALLITYVIPVGVLLVFSAFGPIGAATGEDPVNDLLPSAISLAVIGAQDTLGAGSDTLVAIENLYGSPAGTSVVVAAKSASVVLVELVQLVLLVGIATARPRLVCGPDGLGTRDLAALVLGTVAFAGLGLLLAGTLARGGDARPREPPVPRVPRAGRHRGAARTACRTPWKGSRACCRPRR
jgi:ABC-2 type transport system permease protein